MVYGDRITLSGVSYTIESGELVDGYDIELAYSTEAKIGSGVGIYYIYGKIVGETIYDCTIESGFLTITPRELVVTIGDQQKEYGEFVTLDNSLYTISSGKLIVTSGWDFAKGFHKPTTNWIPAGAVFNKKINNSCVAITQTK